MKNFYQWLSAIASLIILIVLLDVNLAWHRHPANSTLMMVTRIGCSIILVTLIIWNIYNSKERSKK